MEKIRMVETVQHRLWGEPEIQIEAYVYAPDDERMSEGKKIAREKLKSRKYQYGDKKVKTKVRERRS